jgi:hypothetical protein
MRSPKFAVVPAKKITATVKNKDACQTWGDASGHRASEKSTGTPDVNQNPALFQRNSQPRPF